ncbi:PDZ domain-containing protein 4-like [Lepisosteus oculatus]|uniref:PDZ domain-containing protein 4-like n=1 Tax=Lepisosteus oculatus TaxID=7918 RepID=UPI003713ED8E
MGCRLSGLWLGDGLEINGQDFSQANQQEALRIFGCRHEPITLQIDGWKTHPQRRQTSDCSTQTERPWDTLRGLGVTVGSSPRLSTYIDRPCCNHMTLPRDHYNAHEYLPSIPHDVETMDRLGYKDPELYRYAPKGRGYLIGCCNTNMEDPNSFLNQTEEDEAVREKRPGFPPPLHELDSGLGCTDGSFHQGELSGLETEEGAEEPGSSPVERTSQESPSSESLISSELSDSGFYSVSTGEFRRFQRLLEKKIRLYRAKMASRGAGDGAKRDQAPLRDGFRTRYDLESIPEALTCQPRGGWPQEASPTTVARRCMMGVSSVQYMKAESPRLSRYGSITSPRLSPKTGASPCGSPCSQNRAMQEKDSLADVRGRGSQQGEPPSSERRQASHSAAQEYKTPPEQPHHRKPAQDSTHKPSQDDKIKHSKVGCHSGSWPRGTAEDNRGILPGDICRRGLSDRLGPLECSKKTEKLASKGASARGDGRCQTSYQTQQDCAAGSWPKAARGCSQKAGLHSTQEGDLPKSKKGLPNPRVLRNQLLKARASRLADERGGVTTDEEMRSEVKMGRYWSKTERRRHLLTAREQRQRRLARGSGGEGARRKEASSVVLELSNRKRTQLRNRKLLDSWTTIEELLTHGTKTAVGTSEIMCPSPLLSVTTV